MYIDLVRAHTPEEAAESEACEICGESFVVGSFYAMLCTDDNVICGDACPACAGALGRLNPERFPTPKELAAARLSHPDPVWGSAEEAQAAYERGGPDYAALATARVERAAR